MEVSIIIPVYNGEKWVNACMNSIMQQTVYNKESIEIVVCNDGSTDSTQDLLKTWQEKLKNIGIKFVIITSPAARGVGASKNKAVAHSNGKFLCFQDIDDVMLPNRVEKQLEAARSNQNAIVGAKVLREPPNSTVRFAQWANNLDPTLLKTQIYTSHGPTILMPTWFCHRSVFDKVGGFSEAGKGTPEDLIFFYSHLDNGGDIIRVDEELVIYTYHENATTFSVTREVIWQVQLERLENCVLAKWNNFTVWNAGKAGRQFVRALQSHSLKKVISFCDIDANKIGKDIELFCPKTRTILASLPVVHYTHAKPPLIICMKLGLTNGEFEKNLLSLNLVEGKDFVIFN